MATLCYQSGTQQRKHAAAELQLYVWVGVIDAINRMEKCVPKTEKNCRPKPLLFSPALAGAGCRTPQNTVASSSPTMAGQAFVSHLQRLLCVLETAAKHTQIAAAIACSASDHFLSYLSTLTFPDFHNNYGVTTNGTPWRAVFGLVCSCRGLTPPEASYLLKRAYRT